MSEAGQIPGRYNLVEADHFETIDHQVPVREFLRMLNNDEVPEAVCVVGLDEAFNNDELIEELSRAMDRQANELENRRPLPTIQFAVEGSFHRHDPFDLHYEGELHSLRKLFGRQIERENDEMTWLVAPF